MRPEQPRLAHQSLLLACATPYLNDRSRQAVENALSLPDLDSAVLDSIRHGLAPLLALHLREFRDRIPPPFAALFEQMYTGNAARNRVFFREAARLVAALERAGIPCLVVKGLALALTVYPDPALRNFADIDLLVQTDDYEAAGRVAEQCGFTREAPTDPPHLLHHQTFSVSCPEDILTSTLAPGLDPSITAEILERHAHRVPVEIHRSLFRDLGGYVLRVDHTPLWTGTRQSTFPDGTPFRHLSPEATLVNLASHAVYHGVQRLLYPVDIAAVIQQAGPDLDWNRAAAMARHFNVAGHLYHCLSLVQREFGAAVPADFLKGEERWAFPFARKALTTSFIFGSSRATATELYLRQWILWRGARLRPIVWLHLLAPAPAEIRKRYGVRGFLALAVLYPLRLARITVRLLRAIWRTAKSMVRRRSLRNGSRSFPHRDTGEAPDRDKG